MELSLEQYELQGLWWENRDGFRGLSSWIGGEGVKWGYACSTGSSYLINNPDLVKLFDDYDEAKQCMESDAWIQYIIGGWLRFGTDMEVLMETDHWDSVVDNFTQLIAGDAETAIRLAREAFHEIARCGSVEHSQAVAEAWMRILAPFANTGEGEGVEGDDSGND